MDNIDIHRQRMCSQLVEREVVYCASSLIHSLSKALPECDIDDLSYDDLMSVCVQDDWEEPGIWFINEDADFCQLEEIADHFGDWTEIARNMGYGTYVDTMDEQDLDHDEFEDWVKGQDACHTKEESFSKALRREVEDLVDDWDWVGREFNLDPHTNEAYEHWIVSNWLASKLDAQGEMTGEILGLTIWGRCTTGQSISMDGVIERITADLWPEEWATGEERK